MELTSLIDRALPGPGSALDRASQALQTALAPALTAPAARPIIRLLHGNELLGHPTHPVVIALPVGAWALTGWHDMRAAATGDRRHDTAADTALRFGVVGAVAAAATGLVQYLDTREAARRETAVHAALNTVGLGDVRSVLGSAFPGPTVAGPRPGRGRTECRQSQRLARR